MFFHSKVKQAALLFGMLLQTVTVQTLAGQAAETAEASAESMAVASGEEPQRRYSFPQWPERKQVTREVIPPAPPGPYMSSALSHFSTAGTTFSRRADKPVARMRSPEMPMQAFSPDLAWPSQLASPQRWIPENGYQFVDPAVNNHSNPVFPFRGSLNYYGNPYGRETGPVVPQVAPSVRPARRPATAGMPPRRPVYNMQNRGSRNSNAGRSTAMLNPVYQSRRPQYRISPAPTVRP